MDIDAIIRPCIQKVATGPEMSKSLGQEEAHAVMRLILNGQVDPVQSAVILIALRMKRETLDEYRGILDAIRDNADIAVADVDDLIDVADPYDGYNRCLPATPFLPAVLAACGLPAVSHGVETMSPKFGTTHRMVLRAAGIDVDLTPAAAAARIANPAIGWAYVDMQTWGRGLHALTALRGQIIKRTCLTTVENLIGPIRARGRTHLLAGYVHKAYPPIYSALARHSGFDSALIVRGVEGGVVPSLQQAGTAFYYHDGGAEQEMTMDPAGIGIQATNRAVPLPASVTPTARADDEHPGVDAHALAEAAAAAGLAALRGEAGLTRESLVYAGALCLTHLGRSPNLNEAAARVRAVLDDGSAATRFSA
ncbi:MAG: anthranilate phosphoribosyltransferase [Chromatiales bacterium]|nr:anthranilate phosphoribosyltransferase [Chromatiales bacterium]MDX9766219.1 anthranilate phosphoribosyltransferase [Ectothiorhodospiraceae bacterium]